MEQKWWVWMERRWVIIQLRLVVWILFERCQVFIHPPELLPGFVCLLPDDTQARLTLMSFNFVSLFLDLFVHLVQGLEASLLDVFVIILMYKLASSALGGLG
jgi:hypothetical protein